MEPLQNILLDNDNREDRLGYLDFLRGIAIIMVVMGHLIQYNLIGISATKCFNFIYAFHMGFFFFISGCSIALSKNKKTFSNYIPFVKKKAVRLLVPFFVVGGVIRLTVNTINIGSFWWLPQRILSILRAPCLNAPWFLFSLFFIQQVFYICCALSNKTKQKYILPLLFLISAIIIKMLQSPVDALLGITYPYIPVNYLLLFYLGYLMQSTNLNVVISRVICFTFFLIFIIVTPIYDFFSTNDFYKDVIQLLSSITFSVFLYLVVKNKYEGINSIITKATNYLGRNTLEIYITHYSIIIVFSKPWIDVSGMNSITLFLLVMIVSVIVSYVVVTISKALKSIPYIPLILYGKQYKP